MTPAKRFLIWCSRPRSSVPQLKGDGLILNGSAFIPTRWSICLLVATLMPGTANGVSVGTMLLYVPYSRSTLHRYITAGVEQGDLIFQTVGGTHYYRLSEERMIRDRS